MKFERPHLKVQQPKSAFAEGHHRWTNLDLDPVPRHRRKWGVTSFLAYWISDALNPATWEFASSIIAVGLSWRESLAIVAIGFSIISIVIAGNGAVGVIYHAPFPVIARASWGFWGSYVAIISRVILAVFWYAIQTVNGAAAVKVMLGAIWPSFLTMQNHIPESEGIETNTMVAFFLFWLLQVPFLLMHPNKLRWLFMFKSIVAPITFIAILIWAFTATDGGEIFQQKATISGSAYSWAFLGSLTSVLGNFATLSVNQADFSRYSRVSAKWQLMYIPMLPIVFTFIAFIGIAASSAGQVKYNLDTIPWDPMVLISYWESRACRFFAAFGFAVACLGVNISANSLSAANDFTALAPQYINIRRGQLLCAVLAWALVPWKILASAGSFLNFMSAYAIFLGPIAGIMLFDFWFVKSRKYDSLALYDPSSIYHYNKIGTNPRAIIAFIVGVVPCLPGFINSINPSIPAGGAVHIYQFGWIFGFVVTSAVYVGLSTVWKPHETLVERATLPDEVYDARGGEFEGVEAHAADSESGASGEGKEGNEKGFKKFVKSMDRIL